MPRPTWPWKGVWAQVIYAFGEFELDTDRTKSPRPLQAASTHAS
jgi:hypothetical protein